VWQLDMFTKQLELIIGEPSVMLQLVIELELLVELQLGRPLMQ